MTIGERIRKRREQLGMSQLELAEKIGYKSKSAIAKIELDGRQLPQSKIKAISDALKTTPSFIMGWENGDISTAACAVDTLPETEPPFAISKHEKTIIIAYRNNPNMQNAVDTLLNVKENTGCEIAADMADFIKKGERLTMEISTNIK